MGTDVLNNVINSLDAENAQEVYDAVDFAKIKTAAGIPAVTDSDCTVISQAASATGIACVAGLKGYRYTNTGDVTNSLTFEVVPTGWEVGDVVSIVNDVKYLDCATIASISGTTVTFTENLPFTSIEDDDGWDAKLVYISEKPAVGDVEIGYGAYAEGLGTEALNVAGHAEGFGTKALGQYSHAEGRDTVAQYAAHAEGRDTQAIYEEAHAEGKATKAKNIAAHAEGARSEATGSASHAEGADTVASGGRSHAEGESTTASGTNSHAEGNSTTASGTDSHAEGHSTAASGIYSHAEGISTNAIGEDSHAEGSGTKATSNHSHAEGSGTMNVGVGAHSEGVRTKTNGDATHAEGYETWAGNDGTSTGETPVSAPYAHSEGQLTFAKNRAAHAEGLGTNTTTISGRISGAFGIASHSEGVRTLAEGQGSHSEGQETQAIGAQSHAEGKQTQALNAVEHAQGQYNKSNKATTKFGNAGNTIHSIGIGESDAGRMNAVEVMQNGKMFIKDVGGYDGTNPTESDVKDVAAALNDAIGSSREISAKYDKAGGAISGDVSVENASLSVLSGNIVQTNGSFVGGESSIAERNSFVYGTGVSALGENSYAVGKDSVAGCYGWYYNYLDLTTGTFYLTTEQPDVRKISEMGSEPEVDTTFESGFAVGDVISYVNKNKRDMYATIMEVTGNKIVVGKLTDSKYTLEEEHPNHDDWTIFVPKKPTAGQIWLGECAFAEGSGSKAINAYSHAEGGRGCLAYGQYGHAEGKATEAGYAAHTEGEQTKAKGARSHAEGYDTVASGSSSHAEGLGTIADGNKSHAEGWQTTAGGEDSHAEGGNTQTQNRYEHAQGSYNKSNKANTTFGNAGNTIHSIGIGTSNGRKNAVEVMQDGKVFIKGIGNYDGTNPAAADVKDLAAILGQTGFIQYMIDAVKAMNETQKTALKTALGL